jgi:hypothetical protein
MTLTVMSVFRRALHDGAAEPPRPSISTEHVPRTHVLRALNLFQCLSAEALSSLAMRLMCSQTWGTLISNRFNEKRTSC